MWTCDWFGACGSNYMQIIIVLLTIGVTVGIVSIASMIAYLMAMARNEVLPFRAYGLRAETVSLHTYQPGPNGIIPQRGGVVLHKAVELARELRAPLILSVGRTCPDTRGRTEAQIYKEAALDWILNAQGVEFVLGDDPSIRETEGEIRKTLELVKRRGSRSHLVIISEPHLARARMLWLKIHPEMEGPCVHFCPVKIQARFWVWEAVMTYIQICIPPGSAVHNWLLDVTGRKGN